MNLKKKMLVTWTANSQDCYERLLLLLHSHVAGDPIKSDQLSAYRDILEPNNGGPNQRNGEVVLISCDNIFHYPCNNKAGTGFRKKKAYAKGDYRLYHPDIKSGLRNFKRRGTARPRL